MNTPTNTPSDPPEVAAAIAARKQTLDRQTIMGIVGLIAVALFLNVDVKDHARMVSGLTMVVPWIIGLSVAIFLLNRWTLSIQSKLIRRDFAQAAPVGGAPTSRPTRTNKRKRT
jgi:hypothetical protein